MGFWRRGVVGLEIDQGVIRGIEIIKAKEGLAIASFAQVEMSQEAFREGIIFEQDKVQKAVLELWDKAKFRSKNVVIGISNQGVIIRFATFPNVTPNRLANIIRFQAQEHLPVPVDTVVLDHAVVGTKTEGERQFAEVLLVAGRKEMIDDFLNLLTSARLTPLEIEVLPLALLRFLRKEEANQVVAIIDIGYGLSNMLIADNRIPRMARMMPTGMEAAERLVAATAEDEFSIGESNYEDEELANSIRATIGFYQSHKDAKPVEKILLTGVGSKVVGLADTLEKTLQLPIIEISPQDYLDLQLKSRSQENMTEYAMAMSLACRGWEVRK